MKYFATGTFRANLKSQNAYTIKPKKGSNTICSLFWFNYFKVNQATLLTAASIAASTSAAFSGL
ncbi:hypothetical protein SAMN04488029_1489 [Reichenbachiella faecimaris]|uniref:Uncharacterized protein n=1 Tax=Reichenbachiella faecimaris TaxID=692418 RepID=A0A1W2G9E1_REIFA|nr:hypothetical protein SAMN04488029_1489 [Reichenbachiella faecimaris]